MIITIDGPMASGKSFTARTVAQQLGYHHLNSGLLYRALAYLLISELQYNEYQLEHPELEPVLSFLNPHFLKYTWDKEGRSQLAFHGVAITDRLKSQAIDQAASVVSADSLVRQVVNGHLAWLADEQNIVVDGRDCGSCVFPKAEIKIFLTASSHIRAHRWLVDQQKQGVTFSESQALEQLEQRDRRDSERAVAPLKIPEGAVVINNSSLTVQETVQKIIDYVKAYTKTN